MLLNHKKVAILGAGPVGLTLAKLLRQQGVHVTVYERDKDPHARIWGGTLDLHPDSGQKALQKAGLLERYFALAKPMGRTFVDEQGNVLFRTKPATDNPEINRNDLRKLLLDSLEKDTVVWNRKFTGLEEQHGKWRLHFDHSTSETADVVIGANGGMSTARTYVTDTEVEYSGTYMVQGEVVEPILNCNEFYQRCGGMILLASYQGNSLVANPENNGILTYNIILSKPEEWINNNGLDFQDQDRMASFLTDTFTGWGELYKQLFRSTTSFWGLPIRKFPLEKPWEKDRPLPITLIGDAAHLMPPFAGQGVNTGLMDALILSDNLTNGHFVTIEAAIEDYEQKMRVYATEAQQDSARNEIAMRDPAFSFRQFIQ